MVEPYTTVNKKTNLASLESLCSVVEAGGFFKARDRFGKQAFSYEDQIRRLGGNYGVNLIERTGVGTTRPTAAGRVVYEFARHILSEFGELERELQRFNPDGSEKLPDGNIKTKKEEDIGND